MVPGANRSNWKKRAMVLCGVLVSTVVVVVVVN